MTPMVNRVQVRCPCGEVYELEENAAGERFKCPKCKRRFSFAVERLEEPSALTEANLPHQACNTVSTDWGKVGRFVWNAGRIVTGVLTFLGCWIYCVATYGFLIGVTLGWIPSLIVAVIASYLWPLLVLILIALIAALTH